MILKISANALTIENTQFFRNNKYIFLIKIFNYFIVEITFTKTVF